MITKELKSPSLKKKGKRGCDYCHRVGDVYDYEQDAGKLCPWMLTVANMYIPKMQSGQKFQRDGIPDNAVTFCCPDPGVMNIFMI